MKFDSVILLLFVLWSNFPSFEASPFRSNNSTAGKIKALEEQLNALQGRVVKLGRCCSASITNTEKIKEVSQDCLMGVKSGEMPDSSLTASSIHGPHRSAQRGRLDIKRDGNDRGGWVAINTDKKQWIQVDFGKPVGVAGVVTQGRSDWPQWVTSFYVLCGHEKEIHLKDEEGEKIFSGNYDQNSHVVNMFSSVQTCRYVRICPQTWHSPHISMRFDVIKAECWED